VKTKEREANLARDGNDMRDEAQLSPSPNGT